VNPQASLAVWADAVLAAALFAVDPAGLGGVRVLAAPGPVREAWLEMLRAALPADAPWRKAPLGADEGRLFGGLDLAATLQAGRPVAQAGLLAETRGGVVVLGMAERLTPNLAARLAEAAEGMDRALGFVALDESLPEEAGLPEALAERLALVIDLAPVAMRDAAACIDPAEIAAARARLGRLAPPEDAVLEALAGAACSLGVVSLRPVLLALRVARAHAALEGAAVIRRADAEAAARLVLAPRARVWPEAEPQPPEPPPDAPAPEEPPEHGEQDRSPDAADPPAERLVEAVRAALPEELLAALARRAAARGAARQGGAGALKRSPTRGRPLGVRPGRLGPGVRLALVETLRAAAPWRRLRPPAPTGRLPVRTEDFRIRRFARREGSTAIFLVDASGSAAFQRLAEAKGAVELLLARSYASRTEVALIAFRGEGAALLLAPTRSLTRARRRLADLPGGGATPLAAALEAGLQLALRERARGRTPSLVVLSDGRGNIARDGAPDRARAEAEALAMAQAIRAAGVAAALLDTAPRPRPENRVLAQAMGAAYAPLPYLAADRVVAALAAGGAGP
jgi:magnesium chelatase subunit D